MLTVVRNKQCTINKVPRLFFLKNVVLLFKEISTFQSIRYRNISMDPLGTGRGYLGIRGASFGNHCHRFFSLKIRTCRLIIIIIIITTISNTSPINTNTTTNTSNTNINTSKTNTPPTPSPKLRHQQRQHHYCHNQSQHHHQHHRQHQ